MEMPEGLELWTLDEVAECLPFDDDLLYGKLWRLLDECETVTPIGGDGTNGTVEYPDARYGTTEDDKAKQWWGKLTSDEQSTIVAAWNKENSSYDDLPSDDESWRKSIFDDS